MLPVFRVKTSGWFNSETSAFRVNLFQLLYSTVGRLEEFKVETYPIEQNWTKNQSNPIELQSFDWVRQLNKIEHLFCCEFDFWTNWTNILEQNRTNPMQLSLDASDWVKHMEYASDVHAYNTRYASKSNFYKARFRTNIGKTTLPALAADYWQKLPRH